MAYIVNTQRIYVNTLEYAGLLDASFLIGHMKVRHSLLYNELLIIVYTVTMQEDDNMSVMTIAISWGNKMEQTQHDIIVDFQNLVTHVTGCILHVDPSYNNRYGPSKNYNDVF